MPARQPRYSKEEFARRGDEIYESNVRSHKPLSPALANHMGAATKFTTFSKRYLE